MRSTLFYGTNPTYKTWESMKSRCNNPCNERYKDYGGRGIQVCSSWNISFDAFLADMGERPEGLTLDRKDNNKDYNKQNCRWASAAQQQRNTRKSVLTKDIVSCVEYARRCSELSDRELARQLAKIFGVKHETIREVLKGRCWREE